MKKNLLAPLSLLLALNAAAQTASAPPAPDGISHEWSEIKPYDLSRVPDPLARKTGEGPANLGRFPDIYLHDLTGKERHLEDYFAKDGLTLIFFFAPWCDNSIAAAPSLARLDREWGGRGLHIVAIGEFGGAADIAAFAKKYGWDFPVLAGAPEKDDGEARTHGTLYRLRTALGDARKWGTPTHYFLSAGDRVHLDAAHGEVMDAEMARYLAGRLSVKAN